MTGPDHPARARDSAAPEDAVERMLRRSRSLFTVSPEGCLDAETLAGWGEGTLQAHALRLAEAHLAGCARCRAALAAFARTESDAPGRAKVGPWWRRAHLEWLIPLTAAAGLVLWLAGPDPSSIPTSSVEVASSADRTLPVEEVGQQAAVEPQPSIDGAFRVEPTVPRPAPAPGAAVAAPLAQEELADDAGAAPGPPGEVRREAEPAAPAAVPGAARERAAAPAAAMAVLSADAGVVFIDTPDRQVRWRVLRGGIDSGDSRVDKSTDGGTTWTTQISGTPFNAGQAPAADICWLVGPGGTVRLTTDGQSWQSRDIREPADLLSVQAEDGLRATVTAADGRRFTTADGGLTWVP